MNKERDRLEKTYNDTLTIEKRVFEEERKRAQEEKKDIEERLKYIKAHK